MMTGNPYTMGTQQISPQTLAMMRAMMGQQGGQPSAMLTPEGQAGAGMVSRGADTDRPLTSAGNMIGGAALMGLGKHNAQADAHNAELRASNPDFMGPPEGMMQRGWGGWWNNMKG